MNRCEALLSLLSQIRNLDYPIGKIDAYVVDNASNDGTAQQVRRLFPAVHIDEGSENVGITAGFNLAILEALKTDRGYSYIWLLDDDAEIENQTLSTLVAVAQKDPNIAVVGSAVYDLDRPEHLVAAGFDVDWKRATLTFRRPEDENAEQLLDVDVNAACSSLVRAELFRKMGTWDEKFWLYWGDTDWCIRAKKSGFRICCHLQSRVWHRNWAHVKPDFGYSRLLYDRIRGGLLFNHRHGPRHTVTGIRHLAFKSYMKAVAETFTRRPNFPRACVEGVDDFLKGSFSTKDFSPWTKDLAVSGIDETCRRLKDLIPKNPSIIINQIGDEGRKRIIKETMERHFAHIQWEEFPEIRGVREEHLADHYREYLLHYFPRFLLSLTRLCHRKDLVISSISSPELLNMTVARKTMFLNPTLQACVTGNHPFHALQISLRLIIKGFKIAFIDIPKVVNDDGPRQMMAAKDPVEPAER